MQSFDVAVRPVCESQEVEDNGMIHIPNPSLRRRGLITGAAGMATTAAGLLAAAPVPVLAQPTAPAASGGGGHPR